MYAVSADSKGLDTVVGLLADVVLHPRLTGVRSACLRGPGVGAVLGGVLTHCPGEGRCVMEPWARPPVTVSRGSLETALTIRNVLDTEYFDTSSLCSLTFVAK